MRVSDREVFAVGVVCLVVSRVIGDWIAGAALATLWLGCKLLATHDEIYILPIAFSFHWMQTSIGVFYAGLTGRTLQTIQLSDYRPMVLIGLGCTLALAVGINLGMRLVKAPDPNEPRPVEAFTIVMLMATYAVTVV